MVAKKQSPVVTLPTTLPRRPTTPSTRLATIKQSTAWQQLPRVVQRDYEANENRLSALVHVMERHREAVAETRSHSLDGILASAREWQVLLDELGETISDEERQALLIAKSNELAGMLTSHQSGLDTLNELLTAQLQEVMTRPRHEWAKRTLEDNLEDLWTFGEAELERRGYPPLSFWESVANTVTFGMVADKQLREHERARLSRSTSQTMDEAGEVIDVDFTPS